MVIIKYFLHQHNSTDLGVLETGINWCERHVRTNCYGNRLWNATNTNDIEICSVLLYFCLKSLAAVMSYRNGAAYISKVADIKAVLVLCDKAHVYSESCI